MLQYIWYFFIYAFLGWSTEVIFAAVNKGTFVNRGFLNGPICPIYGFGITIVLACLNPLKDNLLILYVGSVLLTSLLELVTGFLMEKLFHQKWWDYSNVPFNIGGYICLKFSLAWGIACVMIVDMIHPLIGGLVKHIPKVVSVPVLILLGAAFFADVAATVAKVAKLNRSLNQLDELAKSIRAASNTIGENMAQNAIAISQRNEKAKEELKAQHEKLVAKIAQDQRRLLRAFPNVRSSRHDEHLRQIKERLEQLRQEKRKKKESKH